MPATLLVRTNEAAATLGIIQSTLYARAQTGRCPAPIQWDETTVWRVRDLETFVDRLAGQIAGQPRSTAHIINKKRAWLARMVRVEGLEPPRLAAPEPKSGASTNFATPALTRAC